MKMVITRNSSIVLKFARIKWGTTALLTSYLTLSVVEKSAFTDILRLHGHIHN